MIYDLIRYEIWYDKWYAMFCCDLLWLAMLCFAMIWYDIWYHIISYHIISYHMIWCKITSYASNMLRSDVTFTETWVFWYDSLLEINVGNETTRHQSITVGIFSSSICDYLEFHPIYHIPWNRSSIMLTLPTWIIGMGVSYFVTDCHYGVWCRRLTIAQYMLSTTLLWLGI